MCVAGYTVVTLAAANVRGNGYLLSYLVVRHIAADFRDVSGKLMPECQRMLLGCVCCSVLPHSYVRAADGCGTHLDQNLVRRNLRFRYINQFQMLNSI